jgi:hypothetical protein
MSKMQSGTSGGGWLGAAFLAFLVVLVGVALAIVVWSGSQPEPDVVPPTAVASGTVASASGDLGGSPVGSTAGAGGLSGCVAELAAAEVVLTAARIGVGHWAEHVQSRTDLLAGIKSKADVSATWKRTRQAGPADLQRYDSALAVFARFGGACSAVKASSEPELVKVCKHRAQAVAAVLAVARAAVGDWRSHQAAMAAHKTGDFDAAHAQMMWVAAWTAAPANLDAFRAADARLASTPPCHS